MNDEGLRYSFVHDGPVRGALHNGAESQVLTWSGDGSVRLWGSTQDEPIRVLKHEWLTRARQLDSMRGGDEMTAEDIHTRPTP